MALGVRTWPLAVIGATWAIGCGGRTALYDEEASGGFAGSQAPSVGGQGGTNVGGTGGQSAGADKPTGGTSAQGGADTSDQRATGGVGGVCDTSLNARSKEWIDDMEDGSGHIFASENRTGVWYAFHDNSLAGTQWPSLTDTGVPIAISTIPEGRDCSTRAVHTYGNGFADWGAGVGFDLAFDGQTYGSYDVSAYDGITFWARGDSATVLEVRVSTATTTRAEWGGTCQNEPCPYPLSVSLRVDSPWRQYWVPFAYLHNSKQPTVFEPTQVTNIQFFVPASDQLEPWPGSSVPQTFDFWIDDIRFYQGPAGCCDTLPKECQNSADFPDPELEQAVRKATSKPTGELSCRSVRYILPRHLLGGGPQRTRVPRQPQPAHALYRQRVAGHAQPGVPHQSHPSDRAGPVGLTPHFAQHDLALGQSHRAQRAQLEH